MKSKVFEFSLAEISFILLFFLLIIVISNQDSKAYNPNDIRDSLKTCLAKIDSLKGLKSRLWPSSKEFLFKVNIVDYNQFIIDGELYASITYLRKRYDNEIKKSKEEEFVYKIKYSFDPSLSSKDLNNSLRLLRQYFRLFE
ncbi:MAG: hypothetical protein ISS28_03140 [Candidatus Cloacimonetes bacterium]|nr:hypothetical protein [Candidatus Cloacimonadota bacterium]MBL7086086.1 hypothetical protein [Candidatus Cloacimonadota bacterium]